MRPGAHVYFPIPHQRPPQPREVTIRRPKPGTKRYKEHMESFHFMLAFYALGRMHTRVPPAIRNALGRADGRVFDTPATMLSELAEAVVAEVYDTRINAIMLDFYANPFLTNEHSVEPAPMALKASCAPPHSRYDGGVHKCGSIVARCTGIRGERTQDPFQTQYCNQTISTVKNAGTWWQHRRSLGSGHLHPTSITVGAHPGSPHRSGRAR